jgi:hypothetical protein
MAYNFQERLSEWTTYAGVIVGALAAVVPQVVPVGPWSEAWMAGQLFVSAALVLLPQTAGTTAVENDGLQLLKALADHVPPQYSSALTPFMTVLSAAVMKPKPVTLPPVQVTPPASTPAPVAPLPMAPVPVVPVITAPPATPWPATTLAPAVVEQLPIPGGPVVVDPAVLAQVQAAQQLHS